MNGTRFSGQAMSACSLDTFFDGVQKRYCRNKVGAHNRESVNGLKGRTNHEVHERHEVEFDKNNISSDEFECRAYQRRCLIWFVLYFS